MGTADSKQTLGERVIAAQNKLKSDVKLQLDRSKILKRRSPKTMNAMIKSIGESFANCTPFLEPTLLMAWQYDAEQCRNIIINSCKKVLSAPIINEEYEWFKQYVFPSSIWMFKINNNKFMYQELMNIAKNMSSDIIYSMDDIYNHLETHPKWKEIMNIENKTIISRQDHKEVGLLNDEGIRDILDKKEEDDDDDNDNNNDIETFIDSNLAINCLTTTAKNINDEFQNYIKSVMNHYGDFKAGPMKKVERCLSKIENDYKEAIYPKSAHLLDLIRCSITFNTVNQLIDGYKYLIKHTSTKQSDIKLARIKNGFLDSQFDGGYRDIKINVVYHSPINNKKMICEIQLILNQYLHEKKRIHKLYSILREEEYFKMTVEQKTTHQSTKDMPQLQFTSILNVSTMDGTDIKGLHKNGKCSIDQDMGLLAVESNEQISIIDINRKKMVFTEKREGISYYAGNLHSHNWMDINDKKYLSVQTAKNTIKLFNINKFEEDKAFRICLDNNDEINCCQFDVKVDNVILVKNGRFLEKRAVKKSNEVMVSIKLEEEISKLMNGTKILSLSNDGKWCAIGGGQGKKYCHLIEIDKEIQHKLSSTKLTSSYSPCFINGDAEYVAIGGHYGKIEIWNVEKKQSIKVIDVGVEAMVGAINSINNILAAGVGDKKIRLWDVRNWKLFYSKQYKMDPTSVHLTHDSKYLTIGGWRGEKCVVLQIK